MTVITQFKLNKIKVFFEIGGKIQQKRRLFKQYRSNTYLRIDENDAKISSFLLNKER